MAIRPEDTYPGQTVPADADYPHGSARNITVSGDGTGTPLERTWLNDVWGFLQALLDGASITPSGTPDKVGASDYLDALVTLFASAPALLSEIASRISGDAARVVGPSSATDKSLTRFNGTTGKLVQGSGIVVEDTTDDVSGIGLITYKTPKLDYLLIGPAGIHPSSSSVTYGRAASAMICSTDSVTMLVDLSPYLTDRCTITGWTVRVHPGAARSGGARMYTRLLKESLAGALTQIGSTTYDDTTGAAQSIVGTGSVSETVDRGAYSYSIEIGCGNNASSYPDTIIWALLSISEAGPGLGA